MRRLFIFVALVLASVAAPAGAYEPRFALVVSNSTYAPSAEAAADAGERIFLNDLPNAQRDADTVIAALERLDFEVRTVVNADRAALESELAAFEARTKASPRTARAIVYYVGHSLQLDASLYLAPVGVSVPRTPEGRLPFYAETD